MNRGRTVLRNLILLLTLSLAACSTGFERKVVSEPSEKHDLAADKTFCREYAERYGVISLGPMLGEKAAEQPDNQQRKRLYLRCMQEKGYGF